MIRTSIREWCAIGIIALLLVVSWECKDGFAFNLPQQETATKPPGAPGSASGSSDFTFLPAGGAESALSNGQGERGFWKPAPRESLFSRDYFNLLLMDIKYVATAPARWEKKEWITFSLAALGTGAIALLDKPVWDIMRRNQSRTMDDIADVAAEVGGVYSLAALLPFYVAGEVSGDARMKRVALDGWASSLIAAGMISPALKLVASRSAPKDNEGTYRFRPFTYRFQFSGGPQSFPSGHAAQAFAIASVITSHYEEPWVSLAAYGIASITSSARLYQGVHFVSDLAAGTLIGIAVGKAVVRFNEKLRKEKREGQIFFAPFMIPGGAGVSLTLRID